MEKRRGKLALTTTALALIGLGIFFLPEIAQAASTFKSPLCTDGECNSYKDFIDGLWKWALAIAVPLSVLVIAAAGVVWTTSEGNPDRIGLAKKLIWGVVSGLGLLLLARVLIVDIIGVDKDKYNQSIPAPTTTGGGTSVPDTAESTPSSPEGTGGGFSGGGGTGGGGGGGGADKIL